ncbi:hypothetical protein ACWCQL_13245 [Streptomyces sp. NPDC002073]
MANSGMLARSWSAMRDLDNRTYARLLTAGPRATRLVPCGAGRDAVVISPLRRGLAALDDLSLPRDGGYTVLANRSRQELTVVTDDGWTHLWEGMPGVHVLSLGDWLLVPVDHDGGTLAASWLSHPREESPALWRGGDGGSLAGVSARVDARDLHDALCTVDRTAVWVPVAAS